MTITIEIPKIKNPVTAVKNARHARMIRKSQEKIGPYKPVSYTTIYA